MILSKQYSFGDDERTYTNGSMLIPVFRVEQAIDYYIPKWIPVGERLPEKYGDYLVAWKPLRMMDRSVPHYYEIVEYDPDDEELWIENIEQACGEYEIIAWMPLPELYKEKENRRDRRCTAT